MKKILTLLVLCVTLLIGCETDNYNSVLEDVTVVDKREVAGRGNYNTVTVEGKDTKLELKLQTAQYKSLQVGTVVTVKFDNRYMLVNHIKFKGEKVDADN